MLKKHLKNLLKNIKIIKFKIGILNFKRCNKSVNNLPNSITHLVLGNNFNHTIDNLPNSLTHLTLGSLFRQQISNLPKSLVYLETHPQYGKPIIFQFNK